jgi:hypothetical protein
MGAVAAYCRAARVLQLAESGRVAQDRTQCADALDGESLSPRLGMDDRHIRQPPPAVRFQAENSNDCWQFDLSPSDLKQVPAPLWLEEGRGTPTLMLFSVVDDRSGAAYQEYRLSMAKMPLPDCAFCSTPWRPRRKKGWSCRVSPR